MKIATPILEKSQPLFPSNPPLKVEVLSSPPPPFLKIWFKVQDHYRSPNIYRNSTSYPNSFVTYYSLLYSFLELEYCILILEAFGPLLKSQIFPGHKDQLHFHIQVKNVYIWMDYIFVKTQKTSFFVHF